MFAGFAVFALLLAIGALAGGIIYSSEVLAASGGGWATLSAVFFALWQFALNSARQASALHLDLALRAYREAYDILLNEDPTRVNWILAARLLGRAAQSSEKISTPEDKATYLASVERLRLQIRKLLERQPIEFFFGVPCTAKSEKTPFPQRAFDAALKSTTKETVEGLHASSTALNSGSEHSSDALYTIWKMTNFPNTYVDPLLKESEGFEDQISLHENMGLRSYLCFSRLYYLNVDGTAIVRRSDGKEVASRDDPASP